MKIRAAAWAILLVFGAMRSVLAAENATTNASAAGSGVEVGLASRDGILISGTEMYLTRNGVSEKLVKELQLPSGLIAKPDGTVILPNHSEVSLRPDQVITLQGKILNLPHEGLNVAVPPAVRPGPAGAVSSLGSQPHAAAASNTPTVGPGQGEPRDFFMAGDTPFIGAVNTNGTITTSTGTVVPIDGSIRKVVIRSDGRPVVGVLTRDGSAKLADGSIIYPNGAFRNANGSVLSRPAQANSTGVRFGSVEQANIFLGSDGLPFSGTVNKNGTITTADGTSVPITSAIRAITFGADGVPAIGMINANGQITRSDGASVAPNSARSPFSQARP